MDNIYTRELFNDGKGTTVWIAWCDTPGLYELGRDGATARQRLLDRDLDWRFIALSALMNQPFEGITPLERETIDAAISRIRSLDERLERRRPDGTA
jgi:hypothetical protein